MFQFWSNNLVGGVGGGEGLSAPLHVIKKACNYY